MKDVIMGYFAYTDDASKVGTSMISDDDNPPSADPKSYPNFVAFNSEDIVKIGTNDPGLCSPTCNFGYFKSMTVSYMDSY